MRRNDIFKVVDDSFILGDDDLEHNDISYEQKNIYKDENYDSDVAQETEGGEQEAGAGDRTMRPDHETGA